jgi:hypothetical protein
MSNLFKKGSSGTPVIRFKVIVQNFYEVQNKKINVSVVYLNTFWKKICCSGLNPDYNNKIIFNYSLTNTLHTNSHSSIRYNVLNVDITIFNNDSVPIKKGTFSLTLPYESLILDTYVTTVWVPISDLTSMTP